MFGIVPTHMQDLALGLVELHAVHAGPPLQPMKVPLDGIPSIGRVNHTTQLGGLRKLAKGALSGTLARLSFQPNGRAAGQRCRTAAQFALLVRGCHAHYGIRNGLGWKGP